MSRLTASLALLLAACGGPRLEHPECKRFYDSCVNRCADRCEPRGTSRADDFWRHEAQVGDMQEWSGECKTCIDHCRTQGERCEEERRRPER